MYQHLITVDSVCIKKLQYPWPLSKFTTFSIAWSHWKRPTVLPLVAVMTNNHRILFTKILYVLIQGPYTRFHINLNSTASFCVYSSSHPIIQQHIQDIVTVKATNLSETVALSMFGAD